MWRRCTMPLPAGGAPQPALRVRFSTPNGVWTATAVFNETDGFLASGVWHT